MALSEGSNRVTRAKGGVLVRSARVSRVLVEKGPLRRIVRNVGEDFTNADGVRVTLVRHELECGHVLPITEDAGTYRRRCRHCRDELRARAQGAS